LRRGGVESDKLSDETFMEERPPQKGGSQLCVCFAKKDIPSKTKEQVQGLRGMWGVLEEQEGVNRTRVG